MFLLLFAPAVYAQNAIPDEARRAFVQGSTLAKEAKTPEQQLLAVESFQKAVDLAPKWADALYNLAVTQELAGRYSDAQATLKRYIQTKPGEKEVRNARDKIYALEAKAKLTAVSSPESQAKKAEIWNAHWTVTYHHSKYGVLGGPYELQSEKKGDVIEFFNRHRVHLRGTISGSGSISWERPGNPPCGNQPVNVSVSPDHNTLQYRLNSQDPSNCQYFSDVHRWTLTRK